MKRITIRDVAKEAGVSITTVSHALSGQGVLKQETRDRVIAIARKMQYIPDWSGQNLKSVETGMLGFLLIPSQDFMVCWWMPCIRNARF